MSEHSNSEHTDKLRETVRELEAELQSVDTIDGETRQVLEQALGEILEKLVDDAPPADHSEERMSDRLTAATEHWEATHPRLTNLLDRLIAGLSQLGI